MKKVIYKSLPKLALILLSSLMLTVSYLQAETKQTLPIDSVAGKTTTIYLNDYAGKVVLIDFWASWCGPCRQSFPWMNAMQKKYKSQGFEVVAINLDSETTDAYDFLKEVPANFTLGFDPDGITAEKMEVEAMPMSYLIDRNGIIRHRLTGFNSHKKSEHEAHIQQLLTETL